MAESDTIVEMLNVSVEVKHENANKKIEGKETKSEVDKIDNIKDENKRNDRKCYEINSKTIGKATEKDNEFDTELDKDDNEIVNKNVADNKADNVAPKIGENVNDNIANNVDDNTTNNVDDNIANNEGHNEVDNEAFNGANNKFKMDVIHEVDNEVDDEVENGFPYNDVEDEADDDDDDEVEDGLPYNEVEDEVDDNFYEVEDDMDEDVANNECEVDGNNETSTPAFRRKFMQKAIRNLPNILKNRIITLKNLQIEHLRMEMRFYQDVFRLEQVYHAAYKPLFDRRCDIITGKLEPGPEEPQWQEDEPEVTNDEQNIPNMNGLIGLIGIPNFWLTTFRNISILDEMIQESDEPLLKKLADITLRYEDEESFILDFHFDKNPYFTDTVLTKKYFLRVGLDEQSPFQFEGHKIYKSEGCTIHWNRKMNITIKTILKKQKHKRGMGKRTVIKVIPNDSFFNFFTPERIPHDDEDCSLQVDEQIEQQIQLDFEVGHFLRAHLIPKAVLYFSGDLSYDEDLEESLEASESEYDDANDEDEEEPQPDTRILNAYVPPECKTQ